MKIQKVAIAGAGTMGSQISWQSAFKGFEVVVYDAYEKGIEQGRKFHAKYAQLFVDEARGSKDDIQAALDRIRYTTDMTAAFEEVDLVSESIPEIPVIKKEFWSQVSRMTPKETILTTNTSSFAPSDLIPFVKEPARFVALHFWSGIWENNLGEVMGHPNTDDEIFDEVVAFAKTIGMLPIPIKKEQRGYVINSLLIPWMTAALKLHFQGVVDFKMVDRVWMVPNGGSKAKGPFALMDEVGLNVCYHLAQNAAATDPEMADVARRLRKEYLDRGKLGVLTGEGFYQYPNPEYKSAFFLQG